MQARKSLDARLGDGAHARPEIAAASKVVARFAHVGAEISEIVSLWPLCAQIGHAGGGQPGGYAPTGFVSRIQDMITEALGDTAVASILTEDLGDWKSLDLEGSLRVAFKPLDGASNLDANLPVATIFSILPARKAGLEARESSAQIAAGFLLYGPQTHLVLTLGVGVDVYLLDRRDATWSLIRPRAAIPVGAPEDAVVGADGRLNGFARAFIEGEANGVAEWGVEKEARLGLGALGPEVFRVLMRGGAACRATPSRLICEAHPIAFIMEQAGGKASTGRTRILDIPASGLSDCASLILGRAEQVEFIERLFAAPASSEDVSPLFGRRGLFRN